MPMGTLHINMDFGESMICVSFLTDAHIFLFKAIRDTSIILIKEHNRHYTTVIIITVNI